MQLMIKMLPFHLLLLISLLSSGCTQKAPCPEPPPSPKEKVKLPLYVIQKGKPFRDPVPVDENRSIFYNEDVLTLHDAKERYKNIVIRTNKIHYKLNNL